MAAAGQVAHAPRGVLLRCIAARLLWQRDRDVEPPGVRGAHGRRLALGRESAEREQRTLEGRGLHVHDHTGRQGAVVAPVEAEEAVRDDAPLRVVLQRLHAHELRLAEVVGREAQAVGREAHGADGVAGQQQVHHHHGRAGLAEPQRVDGRRPAERSAQERRAHHQRVLPLEGGGGGARRRHEVVFDLLLACLVEVGTVKRTQNIRRLKRWREGAPKFRLPVKSAFSAGVAEAQAQKPKRRAVQKQPSPTAANHDAPQPVAIRKRRDQAHGAAPRVGRAPLPQERPHQVHGEQGAHGPGGHRRSRQPRALDQGAAPDQHWPHGHRAAGLRAEPVAAGAPRGPGARRDPARARPHRHEQRHLGLRAQERTHARASGLARRHLAHVPGPAARQRGGPWHHGGGQDCVAGVAQQEEGRGLDARLLI